VSWLAVDISEPSFGDFLSGRLFLLDRKKN
jgi:hypothetical protein